MKLTKEDLKWKAETDALTLIEADAVKADKARLKRALSEAKRIAKEAENRAKAAKRVAKVRVKKAKKSSTKKAKR